MSDNGKTKLASKIVVNWPREIQLIRWEYPPSGWVKVNNDVAKNVNDKAACWGLIKGNE